MLKSLAQTLSIDGSHAGGLDHVPFDGYIAELHKGERVQTAQEAKADDMESGITNMNGSDMSTRAANVAISRSLMRISRTQRDWDRNGMPPERVQ